MSDDDPTLLAKYRVPLDDKNAGRLRRTVNEWPNHTLAVEGVFLVVRSAGAA